MSVYPTLPADYKTLKNACRKGLSVDSREYWWPLLTQVSKETIVTEYPNIDAISRRLVSLVSEYFSVGSANATFEWKSDVIMKALLRRKNIERPELLSRLIRVVAECIPQIEVCYLIGCDLITNADR